ncbi:hypothetical protein [Turneriella parva]|nr:hypothetical protein [Turneriella parva]
MRTSERCAYNHDQAACLGGQVRVLQRTATVIQIAVKAEDKENAPQIAKEFLSANKEVYTPITLEACKQIFGESINFKDLNADYSGRGYWECRFTAKLSK